MVAASSWLFFLKIITVIGICLYGVSVKRKEVFAALVCVAVGCFVSINPYGNIEFVQMETVLFCLLFFSLCMNRDIDPNTVYLALSVGCLIQCGWLLLNYLGHDPFLTWLSLFMEIKREIVKPDSYTINGSLGHINHSAAYIAITMPFLNKKLWFIPIATVLAFGTALPIVCTALAVAFTLGQHFKKTRYVWVGIALLAFLSILLDSSIIGTNQRLSAWIKFYYWHNLTFFGNGFGYIAKFGDYLFNSGAPERFYQMHNELIETYAVFGIPGLFTFGYLFRHLRYENELPEIYTAVSVALVNSLGNFTFHIIPIFITVSVCYALLIKGAKNGSISI